MFRAVSVGWKRYWWGTVRSVCTPALPDGGSHNYLRSSSLNFAFASEVFGTRG
ncbi:hypothetical protein KGM_201989 [Danaus plexippus plexippus]|uniref:Uncharacterized protein n=1 Tax=Danaus plexippus plexippus TaxID=278856 RepID=A0A212EPL1_DANPL|nr:hypothetical protein KGM_201989 [Danaus plexippus plexippus]